MIPVYHKSSYLNKSVVSQSLVREDGIQLLFAQLLHTTKALQNLRQVIGGLAIGISSVCLLVPSKAEAASLSFTKVADNQTTIPPNGKEADNLFFGSPSINDKNVVFEKTGPNASGIGTTGIYASTDGLFNVIADDTKPYTLTTGSTGRFGPFSVASFSSANNGNVAFVNNGSLYTNIGGLLNAIDINTPIPNGTGNFSNIAGDFGGFSTGTFSINNNGSVVFIGFGAFSQNVSQQEGIHTNVGGVINVVADRNTPIPGGTENFGSFKNSSIDNNGNVTFIGDSLVSFYPNPYSGGIYTNVGGSLNVIADRSTPIPGGIGNFGSFASISVDRQNGSVAFSASSSQSGINTGIYTNVGGRLNVIADTSTLIPGSTGDFNSFGTPSIDNGSVAFLANTAFRSPFPEAIYTNLGGELTKVIAAGDSLDGKTIDSLQFKREGLSGNQIGFSVRFTNASSGIYIATLNPTSIPESSTTLSILAVGALSIGSIGGSKYK